MLAVRWYLRLGLSFRDLEKLLTERGIDVDHVTSLSRVHRFTPMLIDAARPCRHAVGSRWFVDETYVKVAGVWRYVYRAVDQHGQVIDVLVSNAATSLRPAGSSSPRSTRTASQARLSLIAAAPLANVIAELMPQAMHNTGQYANNRIECDHGRLKRVYGR